MVPINRDQETQGFITSPGPRRRSIHGRGESAARVPHRGASRPPHRGGPDLGGLAAADLARLEATCRALRPLAEYAASKLCVVRAAFVSLKRDSGHVTTKNLPGLMKKLRGLNEVVSEEEIAAFLSESYPDSDHEIEFESFLRVHTSRCFSDCNVDWNGLLSSIVLTGLGNLVRCCCRSILICRLR